MNSVKPEKLIPVIVQNCEDKLRVVLPDTVVEKKLADIDKILVVGAGKVLSSSANLTLQASGEMAISLLSVLRATNLPMTGIVNVAKGQTFDKSAVSFA